MMRERKSQQDFTRSLFDRKGLFDKPEPLKGVRVVEVCSERKRNGIV